MCLDALPLSYTGILIVKAANGGRHSPFTYYTEKISLSSFQELAFQELAFQGKRAVFFLNIRFHSIPLFNQFLYLLHRVTNPKSVIPAFRNQRQYFKLNELKTCV